MTKARTNWIFVALLLVLISANSAMAVTREQVLVGRVSDLDGELLYYVPAENDWVAAVRDAPFGLDDTFYSGEDGKAEFILPNRTRLRIGALTQVQLITLNDDLTQVDIASGMARLVNNSSGGVIKATTPLGYVVADHGAVFDIYVGDQSVEVIPIEGTVEYVGKKGATRYGVEAGTSIIADASVVTDGDGTVDSSWQAWNDQRDSVWAKRVEVKGESVRYLPQGLHDEASFLDENGRWEKVYYEGSERELWRPANVGADWEPFTAGRWTTYHGDNAWIPEDEPFGYVTHHYGNWVYLDTPRAWYWAPPVVVAAATPSFGIGFSWYPGRVGWIHSGVNVGWFPLAPVEPYYAHRSWGPRTVVVSDVSSVNININNYRFVNQAVVVPQPNLFAVRNYRGVRLANIDRARIARDFRPVPVLNNRVIPNFGQNRQRFQFTPTGVARVPHNVVVQRIRQNQRLAAQARDLRANTVERNLRGLRQGTIVRNASVQQPTVSNRLVNRNQINRQRQQVQFQQQQLKRQAVQLQGAQERRRRAQALRQQRQLQQPRQQVQQQRAQKRQQQEASRLERQQQRQQLRQQQQAQKKQQQLQRRERQQARQQQLQQQRTQSQQQERALRQQRTQAQQQRQQLRQQRQAQGQQQQLQRRERQRARQQQLEQQRARQQQLQQQRAQRSQQQRESRVQREQLRQQQQAQRQQQQLQRQDRQRARQQQLGQQRARQQQLQQQRAQRAQQQRETRAQRQQQQLRQQQQAQREQRQQQRSLRQQQQRESRVQAQQGQQLRQQRQAERQQVQQQRAQAREQRQAQRRQQRVQREQQLQQRQL